MDTSISHNVTWHHLQSLTETAAIHPISLKLYKLLIYLDYWTFYNEALWIYLAPRSFYKRLCSVWFFLHCVGGILLSYWHMPEEHDVMMSRISLSGKTEQKDFQVFQSTRAQCIKWTFFLILCIKIENFFIFIPNQNMLTSLQAALLKHYESLSLVCVGDLINNWCLQNHWKDSFCS